mgnify:CR=1 FL=1
MKKGKLIKCIFSKECPTHMFSINILIKIKGRAKRRFLAIFPGVYIWRNIMVEGGWLLEKKKFKVQENKMKRGKGKRRKNCIKTV